MAENRADADSGAFLPGRRLRLPPTGNGPLLGLRLAVKDLFDIEGVVTGGGNPDWLASGRPADRTAEPVRRLLSAGATCVGKTVTDELAFSLEGRNAHYGTPRNPRDPGAMPGGSSSGSAAAVAAGEADIGLGTDTGGSVRVPGAFCGLWAMRPSHGRVPTDGMLPFAPGYDTVGWLTRDAATLAAAGAALLEPDAEPAPITRILVAEDALPIVDADVAHAVATAARRRGARPAAAYAVSWQQASAAYTALQARDIRAALGHEILRRRPRFGLDIAPRFEGALGAAAQDLSHHEACRAEMRRHLEALLQPGTALMLPTTPVRRLPLDVSGERLGDFYHRALALCAVAGHAGAPQIHLPLGEIGFSLVGRPGADRVLLDLACDWSLP